MRYKAEKKRNFYTALGNFKIIFFLIIWELCISRLRIFRNQIGDKYIFSFFEDDVSEFRCRNYLLYLQGATIVVLRHHCFFRVRWTLLYLFDYFFHFNWFFMCIIRFFLRRESELSHLTAVVPSCSFSLHVHEHSYVKMKESFHQFVWTVYSRVCSSICFVEWRMLVKGVQISYSWRQYWAVYDV